LTTASLHNRFRNLPRELVLFIVASFAVGMAASLVDSSLNNFLNDTFHLTGFQRSFLEFPREFPGVITLFVSAALWFLGSRRLGGVAMIFAAVGIFLIGFSSSSYLTMVVFLLFIVWETISSCRSRPPWGWNWRRKEKPDVAWGS